MAGVVAEVLLWRLSRCIRRLMTGKMAFNVDSRCSIADERAFHTVAILRPVAAAEPCFSSLFLFFQTFSCPIR
jgi:hypothetical protein